MSSVTIQPDHTAAPDVVVYGPTAVGYFVSLVLGHGVSVRLPGFNAQSAAYARSLAALLLASADELDARVAEMVAAAEAQP